MNSSNDPDRQTYIDDNLSEDELAMIDHWNNQAELWHDENVPAWKAPKIETESFWLGLRQWFPTFASAAALAMVAILYIQQPNEAGVLPTQSDVSAQYSDLPPLPKATQAAMVETMLQSSRDERQQELQALLAVIKGEMDRRSTETEDSLRYVISHQLQGQKQLQSLYQQVVQMLSPLGSEPTLDPQTMLEPNINKSINNTSVSNRADPESMPVLRDVNSAGDLSP